MADAVKLSLFMCLIFAFTYSLETTSHADSINEVHIIFMNHLDVGYNGVHPKVGFINEVLNTYFTQHFPRALQLVQNLTMEGYSETFVYTTHPWLVELYLNCPDNLTLSSITLKCPSEAEKQAWRKALQRGDVTYHAGPMNMQPENMNQMLFELSLNVSKDLDDSLGLVRKFRTLSQRDVPGMTKAVIPVLLRKGIVALSVGVNDGTSPPAVPSIFTWKFDEENQIIAMWHPGGYPDNPGPNPSKPGGLSRKDCVTVANFNKALCFAFRTDNSGPPNSVQEILSNYEILRAEFPGAKLFASSLEKFVEAVQPIRSQLPVISGEIGDTWISGIASDPRKMAEYRVATQQLTDCINTGVCDTKDPRINRFVFYLMKLGEHTWGLPSIGDTINYNNEDFNRAKTGSNYRNCSQAWLEQRQFLDLALSAVLDHPLHYMVTTSLKQLTAVRPDLKDYKEVDKTETFRHSDGTEIAFASNGAIRHLYDKYNNATWAKYENFGRFIYQTYDEGDFNATNEQYAYSWWIFTKPNLTRSSHAKSMVWETGLNKLYKSTGEDFSFLLKIGMVDPVSYVEYGAPREIWISYSYMTLEKKFDVTLQWFDKTATRLPESLMYYFTPLPPVPSTHKQSPWIHNMEMDQEPGTKHGTSDGPYSWKIKKLGYRIDPSSIVQNGSQYLHAVDDSIEYTNTGGDGLRISSDDVPLLGLGTIQNAPSPFPVPLSPIEQGQITGFAYNMYNNMWDTNYILWYPYIEGDKNFKARYHIHFEHN